MLPKKAHILLFPLLQAVSGAVVAPAKVTDDKPAITTTRASIPDIEQVCLLVLSMGEIGSS
jgi:hypothetical protein